MTEEHTDRPANADVERFHSRRTAFGSQADAYAFGRPSYPADAVRWTLPADAHLVLDLAAGTGRLTETLLELGLDVIAVEPLDEMRAHIPAAARSLAGTAEAIPVDDASVDAVVVGQAFHWFDVPRAMAEVRRVLRPGGTVGLMWNMLDDRDAWVDEFARVAEAEERFSLFREDQVPPYDGVDGMTSPDRSLFEHVLSYDADRLAAFVLSRSQTILAPPDEREGMLAAVRVMSPAAEFPLKLVCEAWRGVRT